MENGSGEADGNRVLIVAPSPIDRIVIARIVKRIYLKPASAAPEEAGAVLADSRPGLVILDRATKDSLIEPLVETLARLRRELDARRPRVLMVEAAQQKKEDMPSLSAVVDAVIAKPLTQDKLQPTIERLIGTLSETH